jgi:hypothetical protein
MRRTLILAGLLLVLITGVRCTMGVTIPEGLLMDIAQGTLEVGHPMAGQATGARVVGGSPGGCGAGTRYVDVEIVYRGALSGKQYFMTVRYDLVSIDPCEVSTDVIADTGPIPPVLLDNAISSTEVGRWVCESLQ